MWVLIDTDTGEEIDRVESFQEALDWRLIANAAADYDHFEYRWEE